MHVETGTLRLQPMHWSPPAVVNSLAPPSAPFLAIINTDSNIIWTQCQLCADFPRLEWGHEHSPSLLENVHVILWGVKTVESNCLGTRADLEYLHINIDCLNIYIFSANIFTCPYRLYSNIQVNYVCCLNIYVSSTNIFLCPYHAIF